MKVLFALSDEDVSEQIVKRYRKEYKEIITYKNVYYFNAIVKEIQKDKSYDRIVISEDLEQYVTNNINQIDKTIFEKLDAITDEATDGRGKEIPIVFICSNSRREADYFTIKLFSLGIYNALLGEDRDVSEVCKLLKKPRSKKDAKLYYRIDSEEVSYQSESENDVSETEIKNILIHYKKVENDEKKCIASFENIASQYNEQQLKLIIKCLPLNIRAILEEKSDRYKAIVLEVPSLKLSNSETIRRGINQIKTSQTVESLLGNQENGIKKEVIIPTNINFGNLKKIEPIKKVKKEEIEAEEEPEEIVDLTAEEEETIEVEEEPEEIVDLTAEDEETIEVEEEPEEIVDLTAEEEETIEVEEEPEEIVDLTAEEEETIEVEEEPEEIVDLTAEEEEAIEVEEEPEEIVDLTAEEEEAIEVEEEPEEIVDLTAEEEAIEVEEEPEEIVDLTAEEEETIEVEEEPEEIVDLMAEEETDKVEEVSKNEEIYELFTDAEIYASDKKIVAFVGAHQAGTSFLINSLAELLQSKAVNTAILDLTKNRNSYYIYTRNDEDLRNIAMDTTDNLLQERNAGIKVRRNLFVYTSLPEDEIRSEHIKPMLKRLISKHDVILIDCDLDTPINCFGYANEVYLVQNMDILTIQPLTDFLNKLKKSNILNNEKFKVVINKAISVRGLSPKMIISGMSYHTDSKMSETKELFNRNEIDRIIIPFDEKTYSKYLESMVDCDINITGYSKKFMKGLNDIALKICPNIKIKNK